MSGRKDELVDLVNLVNNSYEDGSLKFLGDSPSIIKEQLNRISTGFYDLDWALTGGLVKGAQVEIFGNEGDGKTTLALTILALCQKLGMQGYIVDAEHKLNLDYAKQLGVDIKKILLTQPPYGEKALDIVKDTLSSGLIDIMIIDSVSNLVPLAEINGDFTDANMGAHARLMSKMCRVLTPTIHKHKIIVIYINQVRQKIGMFFGSPETTTGGKALKFNCSIRMKVSSQQIKKGSEIDITKRNVTVNVVKQQWGIPYRKANLVLNLGYGFSKEIDIIQYGLKMGVLQMASSSVRMDKRSLGNGKYNAGVKLLTDKKLKDEFDKRLKEIYVEGN